MVNDTVFEEINGILNKDFKDFKLVDNKYNLKLILGNKEDAKWFEKNIVKYENFSNKEVSNKEGPIHFEFSIEPIGDINSNYEFYFTIKNKRLFMDLLKNKNRF